MRRYENLLRENHNDIVRLRELRKKRAMLATEEQAIQQSINAYSIAHRYDLATKYVNDATLVYRSRFVIEKDIAELEDTLYTMLEDAYENEWVQCAVFACLDRETGL